MRTDQTALLLQDKSRRKEVNNFRPVTCLALVQKLLICFVADELLNLEESDLPLEEQKGYRRNRYQLGIGKEMARQLWKVMRRKFGLSMVCIDYRKVCDIVPCSLIRKSIEMSEVMKMILTSGNEELLE